MDLNEARSVLMALVMKADDHIRRLEVDAGQRIVDRYSRDKSSEHWISALDKTGDTSAALACLIAEPEATRAMFIADLWEMAIADTELHESEDRLIRDIADALDVPPYPEGIRPLPVLKKQ